MSTPLTKVGLDEKLEIGSSEEDGFSAIIDNARAERDFQEESSSFRLPHLEETIKLYPEYFANQIKESGFQFFGIGDDVPTPLVWLFVNNPDGFISACNWYSELYLNVRVDILNGKIKKIEDKAKQEIKHIKEEFESSFLDENYLFSFNFNPLKERLGGHISQLYYNSECSECLDDAEKKKYQEENIKPLELKYKHILDNGKQLDNIKSETLRFYGVLKRLDNLLQERGFYETNDGF